MSVERRRSYGKELDVTAHIYWFRKTEKLSDLYCKQTTLKQVSSVLVYN